MRKKLLPIPIFKTIPEEAKFWDTHSTEDFPDYWQEIPDVLSIRLDGKIKKAIEKVARKKGVRVSDAVSMLIQERLIQLKI